MTDQEKIKKILKSEDVVAKMQEDGETDYHYLDEKLKPCPFCGGKAKVWEDLFIRFVWTTYCVKCGASVREGTKEKVIEVWNRRARVVAE